MQTGLKIKNKIMLMSSLDLNQSFFSMQVYGIFSTVLKQQQQQQIYKDTPIASTSNCTPLLNQLHDFRHQKKKKRRYFRNTLQYGPTG